MKFLLLFSVFFACIVSLSAQPKAWEEKKVYATLDLAGDSIVILNALFAPGKVPTLSNGDSARMIDWKQDTMMAETEPVALPSSIGKMISGFKVKRHPQSVEDIQKLPVRLYKSKRDSYVYSVDIFSPYLAHYLIFQSFGRAFFIPDFQKPLSVLHVSSPGLSSLKVYSCALEARDGQLPVFFCYSQALLPDGKSMLSPYTLGLVSPKTGKLRPLGIWSDELGSSKYGPIAWIDDHTLALVSYSRSTTHWAAFDVVKKAVVAQGQWDNTKDDKHFIRDFIIRDGCLYGLQPDNAVVQLYPGVF